MTTLDRTATAGPGAADNGVSKRTAPPGAKDACFLVVVVVASALPYLGHLGFYSDDWALLVNFFHARDQSILGLYRSINVSSRPVQGLFLSVLYRLFGPQPLGYHVANLMVMSASAVVFYLLLRRLRLSRVFAVTIPLVYALLPHYSSDRFWVAAYQANVSVLFALLGFYCHVRAFGARDRSFWVWLLLGVASLVVSGLAYEVALPLFLIIPAILWLRSRNSDAELRFPSRRNRLLILSTATIVVLLPLLLFKVNQASSRIGIGQESNLRYFGTLFRHAFSLHGGQSEYGLNFLRAVEVNYWQLGLQLPSLVVDIVENHRNVGVFMFAVVLSIVIAAYLSRQGDALSDELSGRITLISLAAWGLFAFVLGYAIFLTNWNIQHTPTGIGNRTAVAAAIGVAVFAVGALGWLLSFVPRQRWRTGTFVGLMCTTVVAGFLVNTTLASYWVDAWREEKRILGHIERQLPSIPANTTVILDGFCRYLGPAVVFESDWDLAGALGIRYRDTSLKADVVKPKREVGESGLTLWFYNKPSQYPYGDGLLVYNVRLDRIYTLRDAAAARAYFAGPAVNDSLCPPSKEGAGVPVFS